MDKNIQHIGRLTGQVLLFGGVYSNLQALEALVMIAEEAGIAPDQCLCTGDIVGYCAQPEETIRLFKEWGAKSILGNVEEQLIKKAEHCGCDFESGTRCDSFSKTWYPYAKSKVTEASLSFLNTFPDHIQFEFSDRKITLVHGSFNNRSAFIFRSTPWEEKQASFEATESNVIVAGHCGLPFRQKTGENIWLNPGVIGMPANEGMPRVWYAILEEKGGFKTTFHSFSYDHAKAQKFMMERSLPAAYAKTLSSGLWDNMEILPETEQLQQGKPLFTNSAFSA